MTFRFIFMLVTAGWFFAGAPFLAVATGENPYAPIVTRNVFALVPIPTNPPVDPTPATPPPKITPNGIMTLFGKLQVLFKVAGTAKPGLPAKDESYVLGVGERQDEIEVRKIDEPSATITFNNHGTVQELPLVTGAASGGAAPGGIPAPAGVGLPASAPSAVGTSGRGVPLPAVGGGRAREWSGGGNPVGSNPQDQASAGGLNFGNRNSYAGATRTEPALTPEAQVIMMEANRLATQDAVNKWQLPPLPPTPITPPDATGPGGMPLIPPPPAPPPLPGEE